MLSYEDKLTLDQLSKISSYKIIPRIGGSEIDQDGNLFETTYIGSQRWMAQNLDVTHFSNGDAIKEIYIGSELEWFEAKDASYYSQSADQNLYNLYVIADNRNVCPSGWHIPTESEWGILIDFLGINRSKEDIFFKGMQDYKNINEFRFLKPTDRLVRWKDINWGNHSGDDAIYWVKTDVNSINYGKVAIISNDGSKLTISSANANSGLAIRCIKD